LEKIGEALKDQSRLVGLHFFNPVSQLSLVEVVKGKGVKEEYYKKAMAFVRRIDKLPLPVKSSPGFLVNRVLFPYMLEAMTLIEEGVLPTLIDKAAIKFGMPIGPVELADVVGLDVCLLAFESLDHKFFGEAPTKLRELVAQGNLGKKTGKGFYTYKKGKKIKLKKFSANNASADLIDRMVVRMLNETVACLREGIVEDQDLLDAGCILGFGFAPFRGGPLTYAHERGFERLLETLKDFRARYGERFSQDAGWQEVA